MFEKVNLAYDFNALEPYIDTLTMETHYGKHHTAYTNTLNDACEKAGLVGKTIEEVLTSLDSVADEALRKTIRNNGGGYYNHNLYFSILSPNPKKEVEGKLAEKINEKFGSLDNLKAELTKLATTQFGSGWAFLSVNEAGDLLATNSPNQDNPLSEGRTGYTPILGIDVWEHAYYLTYKNLRADYVKNFFEVLDWAKVEERFNSIVK